MTLNLHLVRVFAAVVASGSFTGAAGDLHLSQPAVSRAVAELERQLGHPLLERGHRVVRLTPAGELLYDHARRLFAIERAAEAALEELDGLERGQLAIGASTTIGTYMLPGVLGAFHRRHPAIRLLLDIGNTAQVVERLRGGSLETAFVEGPVSGGDLLVTAWREDRLVVVAAPGHPVLSGGPVPLERLLAEPFILREPGSGTREVLESTLRLAEGRPPVAMELGSTEAVKRAVEAGLGLSAISVATIEQELALGRLALVDVPGLRIARVLSQVRLAGSRPSRALRAFDAMLAEDEAPDR